MAELKLEIWVDNANKVHVEEQGNAPADRHHASQFDKVRWKRKTSGQKPFERWEVRLEAPGGGPLPGADSPFAGQRTDFGARQGQPDGAEVVTGQVMDVKYSIYCYQKEDDSEPFAEEDPKLVINDPDVMLRAELDEIRTRLARIEELLAEMSRQLRQLATASQRAE